MKIDQSKGFYSFQLEEDDMTYNVVGTFITAKEAFLNHLSDKIDAVINERLDKLVRLERLLKEEKIV